MGMNAVIYCQTRDAAEPPNLEFIGFSSHFTTLGPTDATHEVDCDLIRYYSDVYQRGHWPRLAAALMTLLQDPNVLRVWYGSDAYEPEHTPECTAEDVLRLSALYMDVGRAYFDSR